MGTSGSLPRGQAAGNWSWLGWNKSLLLRQVQSSYASTYTLKHLKSKSEMFWGKILQWNASTIKITKQLPKIYSLRCLQQHSRALVMLDIVIYIQNYRCSWWIHCLSQKLENWIQTSLPNPTFHTNSAELKSQSNAYSISKRLNMLHLCSLD
jgi:hypothetical protein